MARDHPDLKLAVDHAAFNRVERRHKQMQVDIGRQFCKQGNGRTQMGRRVGRRFVKHRDVELPAHAPVSFVHAGPKGVGASQQAQGLGVDLLAFGGQGKTGAAPTAQGQPEARFQVLDVAAHGGGANVEFQLGRRHAAALDHAFEHPQQANVHVTQLAQRGPAFYLHSLATE